MLNSRSERCLYWDTFNHFFAPETEIRDERDLSNPAYQPLTDGQAVCFLVLIATGVVFISYPGDGNRYSDPKMTLSVICYQPLDPRIDSPHETTAISTT